MMFAIYRNLYVGLIGLLMLAMPLFAGGPDGLKVRVAVIDFEDKAGYGHNIGRGVADMVVTSLVETKKFTVLERAEMDKNHERDYAWRERHRYTIDGSEDW